MSAAVLAAVEPGTENSLTAELADRGVTLYRVPLNLRRRRAKGADLKTIRSAISGSEIVHIHGLYETLYRQVLGEAKHAGLFSVVSPHGMLTPWSLRHRRIKKWVYRKLLLNPSLRQVDIMNYATATERDQSVRDCAKNSAQVVISIPIDFGPIDTAPPPEPGTGFGPDPAIVFVGRIVKGKGVDVLINAMQHVKHPAIQLVLIGDDQTPYALRCQKQAEALGVSSRVRFLGRIEPPMLFTRLRAAHLFALPSEHENFGQSAIEAMACGVPTLVAKGVAVGREAVEAKAATWISRDPLILAKEFDDWLADEPRRSELGESGRDWTRQQFRMETIADRWLHALPQHRGSLSPEASGPPDSFC